jgi:hypothetical protein
VRDSSVRRDEEGGGHEMGEMEEERRYFNLNVFYF